MSLPDELLYEDEKLCEVCGFYGAIKGRLCFECRLDNADLYADEAIEDRKERGRHA